MSEWVAALRGVPASVEPEILEESAIAMAQATLEAAIKASGLSRAELARRMRRPRSYVSRLLSGEHNLTVRTYARALAACGFEPRFHTERIRWGWSSDDFSKRWSREDYRESGCSVAPASFSFPSVIELAA